MLVIRRFAGCELLRREYKLAILQNVKRWTIGRFGFLIAPVPEFAQNRGRSPTQRAGTGNSPGFVEIAFAFDRGGIQRALARLPKPVHSAARIQQYVGNKKKKKKTTNCQKSARFRAGQIEWLSGVAASRTSGLVLGRRDPGRQLIRAAAVADSVQVEICAAPEGVDAVVGALAENSVLAAAASPRAACERRACEVVRACLAAGPPSSRDESRCRRASHRRHRRSGRTDRGRGGTGAEAVQAVAVAVAMVVVE